MAKPHRKVGKHLKETNKAGVQGSDLFPRRGHGIHPDQLLVIVYQILRLAMSLSILPEYATLSNGIMQWLFNGITITRALICCGFIPQLSNVANVLYHVTQLTHRRFTQMRQTAPSRSLVSHHCCVFFNLRHDRLKTPTDRSLADVF
jgi:hypothetical protein